MTWKHKRVTQRSVGLQVLHKQGHTLYNKVAELVAAHLEQETREQIVPVFPPSTSFASLASGSGSGAHGGSAGAAANVAAAAAAQLFLDRVRTVWDDHMACMSKLRDVLKYMVRSGPMFRFRST